jgi:hypothetical protein
MPIRSIFWAGTSRQDIHLLRGHAVDNLWNDRLFFGTPTATSSAETYFNDNQPPDVTLTFQPLFRGDPSPAQNPPPQPAHNVFSGQGITVDMLTGHITVAALTPPLPENNFIIEVTATNNAGGDPMREAIRVHLHASVTRVALTPGMLTSGLPPPRAPRPSAPAIGSRCAHCSTTTRWVI